MKKNLKKEIQMFMLNQINILKRIIKTQIYKKQKKIIKIALRQKKPSGLNGLGNLYYNSNVFIAVEYLKKDALNVNLGALNDLGICYEYGKGVELNYFKALEYYKKLSDKYYLHD